MTYQYINKQVIAGVDHYDLIIEGDGWQERMSSVAVLEENKEAFAIATYDKIVVQKSHEANKAYILSLIESFRGMALDKIWSGSLTLSDIGAVNILINDNLGQYGISIESPDLKALLALRTESSIQQIISTYQSLDVTEEVMNNTLSVMSAISEVLNGNS